MDSFWDLNLAASSPALFTEAGGWIGYGELSTRADVAVAGWPAHSVFALRFVPSPECVAIYLGALRAGHVALLQDAAVGADINDAVCRHFGIEAVFEGTTGRWLRAPREASHPAVHADLGLLMSTSGSTGSPRLVRLTRANLQANACSIAEYIGLSERDCAASVLPLHYSFGLSVLNTHLLVGGRMLLTSQPLVSGAFWQLFREHQVSVLAAVPTSWRMLRKLRFERMALPALRTLQQAGGRLEPEEVQWLAAAAKAQGSRLFVMYGQTEATARIAYLHPELAVCKPGSIGRAIPGGRLEVVSAEGRPIDTPGVEGELVYRGPNVMMGYAENAADLAAPRQIEALHTGDLGYRDDDGDHVITGRLKRFIKLFGNRMSLDDVEGFLRQQGLEAAVVGRDDQLMVAIAPPSADPDGWRDRLAERYRVHRSGLSVLGVAAIPRNAAGKPLYAQLQAQLDAATSGARS